MKLTDTHTHLASPELRSDTVLLQANEAGIYRFVAPAASPSDWPALEQIQAAAIYCAFGIHPWYAGEADEAAMGRLDEILRRHPRALVGETGLDYAGKTLAAEDAARQESAFLRQLALAQSHGRPVVLHNVRAGSALIRLIKNSGFGNGGFAHAFSGSLEEAREFIRLGFKIGIGSLLLNPNAKKARQAAAQLPLESIVLETDSPFMPKNRASTPAALRRIAEITAGLRGIPPAQLAEQTEKNADAVLSFCR